MSLFRKKPVVIDAHRFPGPSVAGVDASLKFDDWIVSKQGDAKCRYRSDKFIIPTLEGEMEASPGDWIICGVNGELYPCKPDIFEKTYEPA